MRKILLALGIMALICTPAMAGPNANGAIVVHTDDTYIFGDDDQCIVDGLGYPLPATCPELLTTVSTYLAGGNTIWFLAAFLPSASPDVRTIYFGASFDNVNLKVATSARGPCGSGLELPDAGWVSNTTGDTWGFNDAQTASLFRFYWFLVKKIPTTVPPGAFFCSAVNPTGGYASFISSALDTDYITQFGCVKYFQAGSNTCPQGVAVTGACCTPLGDCSVLEPQQCVLPNHYMGDGTVCLPDNPCPQPGACCVPDLGTCTFGLAADCLTPNVFMPGAVCLPVNPCPAKGACCTPITGVCYYMLPEDCLPPQTFMPGLTCLPNNPCPAEHQGACCVIDLGVCVMVYEAQCIAPNTFHPDWICGENDQCPPPVPTQPTTWGQIKANYR